MTKLLTRKNNRLKEYDYSNSGYYFVTICTNDKQNLFGQYKKPVGDCFVSICNNIQLSEIGKIIEKYWNNIPIRYENVSLDEYIIMPNHIHGILNILNVVGAIHESPDNQSSERAIHELPLQKKRRKMMLSKIIGYVKMQSAKQINILRNTPAQSIWQRNYYDHIIRNEKSCLPAGRH